MTRISEVLWKAANECLSDGISDFYGSEYSCLAVENELMARGDCMSFTEFQRSPVAGFLRSLGCPIGSMHAFSRRAFPSSIARQGARYAWLMFASLYAEELEAKGEL